MAYGGGGEKCPKSVTYYLNVPYNNQKYESNIVEDKQAKAMS